MTPEQARQAAYGPWDFHSEKWELAYIKRIDATIAALKSAGVPVIWVGLASQRGTKSSQNSSYLNELYRSRADKAGIIYVDIWDGFVDELGRYSPQGPDYEGQIARLRTGDGVYFTKFGARKLAHYVEREVHRIMGNKGLPVALPIPLDPAPQAATAKPSGPAERPAAGPVVPLHVTRVAPEELLGGGGVAPATDATVTRTITKGEPVAARSGRADDFSWPRGAVNLEPGAGEPTVAGTPAPDVGAKSAKPAQRSVMDAYAAQTSRQKPAKRRPRSTNPNPPFFDSSSSRWPSSGPRRMPIRPARTHRVTGPCAAGRRLKKYGYIRKKFSPPRSGAIPLVSLWRKIRLLHHGCVGSFGTISVPRKSPLRRAAAVRGQWCPLQGIDKSTHRLASTCGFDGTRAS